MMKGYFFNCPTPPCSVPKKRPMSQPEALVDERFHGGAALVGSMVFFSFGNEQRPLWWGSLGVRASTYTNIIWGAVQSLIWCDITWFDLIWGFTSPASMIRFDMSWFDLIWGLTSPARGFVNTRHQVVTLKMKRISKTLEIYKTWMYVSKLCAIIKAKFRDWKCWVSPQNLLKRLIPITPYLPSGVGGCPPTK